MEKNNNQIDEAFAPPTEKVAAGPIDAMQRLIIQNVFDTQPKKREAYMRQLGYELDPKDHEQNRYRPIGSTGNYLEIDPGFRDAYRKGGFAGVMKEAAQDIGDVGWDSLVQTYLTAKGSAQGAMAGKQAGQVVGAAGGAPGGFASMMAGANAIGRVGMVLGAWLGGAAGNAVSEETKNAVGKIFLDETIPQDRKMEAVQSLIVGGAPLVVNGATKAGQYAYRNYLEDRVKKIATAAGLGPELISKVTENPEMFAKEKVKGAMQHLTDFYDNLFGRGETQQVLAENIKGGKFGEKIAPLKQAQTEIVNQLEKNPNANFKVGELVAPLEEMANRLEKFDRSPEEEAAYKFLKEKIQFLRDKTKGRLTPEAQSSGEIGTATSPALESYLKKRGNTAGPGFGKPSIESQKETFGLAQARNPDEAEITFKEAKEFLQAMQSRVFQKDTAGNYINPGSSYIAGAIGGGENAVRTLLEKKAEQAGRVDFIKVNSDMHKILDAYNSGLNGIKPDQITRAFLPGGVESDAKIKIRNSMAKIDEALGTNTVESIDNGAAQAAVEKIYENPSAFGSGRTNAAMVSGGIKGALTGGATGAGAGGLVAGAPGAVVGGIGGAVAGGIGGAAKAGALASPENAMNAIISGTNKAAELSSKLATPIEEQLGKLGIGNVVATEVGDKIAPKKNNTTDIDPEFAP